MLCAKLQLFTKVVRYPPGGLSEPLETTKKGQIRHVCIKTEDRCAGRKFVTRITGMEYYSIDPEELGNDLQKKYKAGASVTALPGKQETGKEVSLQGNLLKQTARYLSDVLGIPEQYIELNDKRR